MPISIPLAHAPSHVLCQCPSLVPYPWIRPTNPNQIRPTEVIPSPPIPCEKAAVTEPVSETVGKSWGWFRWEIERMIVMRSAFSETGRVMEKLCWSRTRDAGCGWRRVEPHLARPARDLGLKTLMTRRQNFDATPGTEWILYFLTPSIGHGGKMDATVKISAPADHGYA